MPLAPEEAQVGRAHHPPVPDEDDPTQPEAFLQVGDDRQNGFRIVPIAPEDMVGNRPAIGHDDPQEDLPVSLPMVPAVAVLGQTLRTFPFEIGRSQIIEDHLGLEAEEIPQPGKEPFLDPLLPPDELVKGPVPRPKEAGVDPNSAVLLPDRPDPLSFPVGNVVGLQPLGQGVLASRADEPVGHKDEGPFRKSNSFALPPLLFQKLFQTQLLPEMPGDKHWTPNRGFLRLKRPTRSRRAPAEQLREPIQVGRQEILAAESRDNPLLDLSLFPVAFHQPNILRLAPVLPTQPQGAQKH